MKPLLAIARLTWKAAWRYRLVVLMTLALLGAVVVLPLIIKDDGTARGFTQILLTYTLASATALLGFSTLWLACGTLARDMEECQMQMVAVKPIPRWKIWLGKWLGIFALNAVLLSVAGGAIYGLVVWRAQKLPPDEQRILLNEILVSRGGLKEAVPDLEPVVEMTFQERLKQGNVSEADRSLLKQQLREQARYQLQLIPSGYQRVWRIPLGWRAEALRDRPLYLRVRFATATGPKSTLGIPEIYKTLWQVGDPKTSKIMRAEKSLAAETFHEFELPPNMFDAEGILTIECANPNADALLFQLEDGLEVLYREGGFGLNFGRGLGIILCWLSLLAAIGLCAGSFLSFPVAAFFSLSVLLVGLSGGTVSQVIDEGGVTGVNHETGRVDTPTVLNRVAVPIFKGLHTVLSLVEGFSPVESLSSGRSISWGQLARAWGQIVLLMGGIFGVTGVIAFNRRELATAQGTQ